MSDAAPLVAEFIATYYPVFVHDPSNLHHFYSSTAVVYRRSQDPVLSVPISSLPPAILALSLPESAKLDIVNYSASPLPDSDRISVSVNGFLELSASRRTSFSQTFVLEPFADRVFVISDSLHLSDPSSSLSTNFVVSKSDDSDDGRLRKRAKRGRW